VRKLFRKEDFEYEGMRFRTYNFSSHVLLSVRLEFHFLAVSRGTSQKIKQCEVSIERAKQNTS
jgi:hypothetical protein